MRLTDAYANAPVCTPTRAALITGRYQQRVHARAPARHRWRPGHRDSRIAGHRPFAAAVAQEPVTRPGLVGKWHLGFKPEFRPNAHGFDYFWGYLAGYIDWYPTCAVMAKPTSGEQHAGRRSTGTSNPRSPGARCSFIDDHARAPFFLEVAIGSPHWPFQSPHHPSVAVRREQLDVPADGDSFRRPAPTTSHRRGRRPGRRDGSSGAGTARHRAEHAGDLHQRQRRRVAVAERAALPPQGHVWEGGVRVPAILRWPGVLPTAEGRGRWRSRWI